MKTLLFSAAAAVIVSNLSAAAAAYIPAAYIENYGHETIWEVNISPSYFGEWGYDMLHEYTIPAGSSMTVFPYYLDGCYYDIRVIFEDGEILDIWHVDLCNEPYVSIGSNGYYNVSW